MSQLRGPTRRAFGSVSSPLVVAISLSIAALAAGCHSKRAAKAPERQPVAEAEGGKCGKVSSAELAESGLLEGRLKIMAPKGAGTEPREHDVMGAPRSPQEESRLKADADGQSLAILAEEIFQLDPERAEVEGDAIVKSKSLVDEAGSYFKAVYGSSGELDVEAVKVKQGEVRAVFARPKEVKVADGADSALVLAMLVSLPDATLQRVSFHVTPGLVGEAAGCGKYAEYLAKTIAVGDRKLDRAGGTQTLDALGQSVSIDVPKGYTLVKQPGPDFDTWRAVKLRTLGNYQGSLALSIDTHPDKSPPKGRDKLKRPLLGKKVEWRGERSGKGGLLVATAPLGTLPATGEEAVKPGKGKRGSAKGKTVFLQVAIKATRDGAYLDELLKIAESVTKKKK